MGWMVVRGRSISGRRCVGRYGSIGWLSFGRKGKISRR